MSDAARGRNGVGTYYDDLVQHLEGRVDAVTLICPPADGENSRAAGWRLPMPGDPTQTLFIPRLGKLWRKVRDLAPHVIVAPTPWLHGLAGMAVAWRTGTPFVVGYHTEFSELADLYWADRPLVSRSMRRLGLLVDALMFRNARAVLVYNKRLQESVEGRGVGNAPLLGTPVAPRFLTAPLRPVSNTLRDVTYVGRLGPEKRIDQVLELARTIPDLRIRIVGDGPLRHEVEKCRAETGNVDLYGWVERDRVLKILDETDLLVLPSIRETFGTAAFEAMIRRRPVLVSSGCGITQWPDLATGLFRIDEAETLVDAFGRVRALGADVRREAAFRGREVAVQVHERTMADWVRTLARAVSDAGT